jgi:hypothetical protein
MIEVIDEGEQELSLSDGRIEDAIIRTNAKLLIIDPVQAYFGGRNMNNASGVRPMMKHLGIVAARHGCAVLLVGHLHKKSGQPQYRGLGSIDIYAAARSVMTVGRIDLDENMRAIVHNKSNLAPTGKPQAFAIDPISGFLWLGDYNVTIDELLSNAKKPESQFMKARRLIETELAGGAVPAADMEQMAEEQGISPKTLSRAKSALGVISIKRNNKWYWEIPVEVEFSEVNEDSQDSQDGHENSVTTLTSLAILHPAQWTG